MTKIINHPSFVTTNPTNPADAPAKTVRIATRSLCVGIIFAASFAGSAMAQRSNFCIASDMLVKRVHEMMTEWQSPDRARSSETVRVMAMAGVARESADQDTADAAMMEALSGLVRARRDPANAGTLIYTNITAFAAFMPDLCPMLDVPDFSIFDNFVPAPAQ